MSTYFQYMYRNNYLIIKKINKYEYNLTAITWIFCLRYLTIHYNKIDKQMKWHTVYQK